MGDPAAYEPDEDDIRVHRFDGRDVYSSASVSYGVGHPHYFVALDENGGDGSWWLDPHEAERLGQTLMELGGRCRQRNAQEERRRAEAASRRPDQHWPSD